MLQFFISNFLHIKIPKRRRIWGMSRADWYWLNRLKKYHLFLGNKMVVTLNSLVLTNTWTTEVSCFQNWTDSRQTLWRHSFKIGTNIIGPFKGGAFFFPGFRANVYICADWSTLASFKNFLIIFCAKESSNHARKNIKVFYPSLDFYPTFLTSEYR